MPFLLVFGHLISFPIIWMPYDDHDWIKESFFPQHPRKILEDGNFNAVPTMIGMTKDEGLLVSSAFYKNPEKIEKFWYILLKLVNIYKISITNFILMPPLKDG